MAGKRRDGGRERASEGPVRSSARDPDAYAQRTEWNVRDSDGTLLLTRTRPRGGSAFTLRCARRMRRPLLIVDLSLGREAAALRAWAQSEGVGTLNVAGPRESTSPGVYGDAAAFLRAALHVALDMA